MIVLTNQGITIVVQEADADFYLTKGYKVAKAEKAASEVEPIEREPKPVVKQDRKK